MQYSVQKNLRAYNNPKIFNIVDIILHACLLFCKPSQQFPNV